MDLKKEFSFDETLSVEGVWVPIGDGAELLVARMNNSKYRKHLRRALLPYTRRGGTMSEKQNREVLADATANCILLDWKGMSEDGNKLKYSVEEAKRLFSDYEDFFQLTIAIASDHENYREAET